MARIDGVDFDSRTVDDDIQRALAQQARKWGAPLLPNLIYARRPSIFKGVRGMWAGLDTSNMLDGKLAALVNARVAAINGCVF